MSRLIDANTFRRFVHEQLENDKLYSADDILEFIDEQPTAYDQEQIINQIHEYFIKVIDDSKSDNIPLEVLTYNKYICKIVRMGGVNNDIG